jgi:hypothetical protein
MGWNLSRNTKKGKNMKNIIDVLFKKAQGMVSASEMVRDDNKKSWWMGYMGALIEISAKFEEYEAMSQDGSKNSAQQ